MTAPKDCRLPYSCIVRPTDKGWIVEYAKVLLGPYYSIDIALRVATAQALTVHRTGQQAKVTVLDQSGNVKAEYPF